MTDAPDESCIPSGLEATELAVLSAILIDGNLDGLGDELRAEDFANPRAALVFGAALSVRDQRRKIDPHSLYRELERQGVAAAAGGMPFIGDVIDMVPASTNLPDHVQIVLDAAKMRAAHRNLVELAKIAAAGRVIPSELADRTQAVVETLRSRSPGNHYQLLSEEELSRLPPPAPLIEGVAFVESLIVLVGRYGTMKTFVLLDLALCIATGRDWHGRRVARGAVIYVCAEGSRGMHKRVAAWRQATGHEGTVDIHFLPRSVLMTNATHVSRLVASIRRTGVQPVAVILDTLARNMDGDEQTAAAMGAFIRGCDQLRETFAAAVFVAHHMGWATERSRGSTSLPGAVDTEIQLDRKESVLTLRCTKQKDAEPFEPIVLEAFPIAGSLALRTGEPSPLEFTKNETRLLSVLDSSIGMKSTAWRQGTGLSKSSFDYTRRRLMQAGYVLFAEGVYAITNSGQVALGTRDNPGTVVGQLDSSKPDASSLSVDQRHSPREAER